MLLCRVRHRPYAPLPIFSLTASRRHVGRDETRGQCGSQFRQLGDRAKLRRQAAAQGVLLEVPAYIYA